MQIKSKSQIAFGRRRRRRYSELFGSYNLLLVFPIQLRLLSTPSYTQTALAANHPSIVTAVSEEVLTLVLL